MRLVLFDLDTALVDRAEGFRRWAWEFRTEHRLTAADAGWLGTADEGGRADRDAFFAGVRARFGLAATAGELLAEYHERLPALVPARPGVLAGLPKLRAAGWRIGVVGDSEQHLATLLGTGISGLVDGWALAEPDGPAASAAGLFALVATRCEADLSEGCLVSADVSAAQAAGLRTVRVAPCGPANVNAGEPAVHATHQVAPGAVEPGSVPLAGRRPAPTRLTGDAVPARDHTVPDSAAAIALLLG